MSFKREEEKEMNIYVKRISDKVRIRPGINPYFRDEKRVAMVKDGKVTRKSDYQKLKAGDVVSINLDDWEKAFKYEKCPKCNGVGKDKCAKCHGRGEKKGEQCLECKGSGEGKKCLECKGSGEGDINFNAKEHLFRHDPGLRECNKDGGKVLEEVKKELPQIKSEKGLLEIEEVG